MKIIATCSRGALVAIVVAVLWFGTPADGPTIVVPCLPGAPSVTAVAAPAVSPAACDLGLARQ